MDIEIKILILEHDLQDVELLQYELRKGGLIYRSETVQNEQAYSAALITFKPDIILSDYSFPSFDGLSAFELRKKLSPDTPFIFVSGAIGEETSVELMKKGVTDFVLKDKLFSLCIKVNRAIKESKEKAAKIKTEQELILSEKRLSRAQQLAHMGSWEFDFGIKGILWSDETFRIYDLPPSAHRQSIKTVLSFIHPHDLAFVLRKMKQTQHEPNDFFISFRIVHKNRSIRHIYLESRLQAGSKGLSSCLHGIIQDVTETVELENKLVQERLTKQNEITAAVLKAQEHERAYIGYELQENINQILATIKMNIKMAGTYPKDRKVHLDMSYTLIGDVIEEVRKISKTLVVPAVDFISLFGRIRNLLYDLNLLHSIQISFHEEGIPEESLTENLQLSIFRIVQEQMNNILQHAKATKATISLSRQDDQVILLISDNGNGWDRNEKKQGVGIINIRSRTDVHQGKVSILSDPGKGYELRVQLPLAPETESIPALSEIQTR